MRNFTRYFFTLMLVGLMMTNTDAQKRFLEPVFDEVEVSGLSPAAQNYTILPWLFARLQGAEGNTLRQPLVFQTYKPKGDTATNRPLVIYIHTGNFFPFPQNGSCGGTMTDSTNVEVAHRLAQMGYVVAVVNYRQGWNPFDPTELVRRYFLINAAYRGVQDMNTYVRFFKRSVAEFGNPHGIDPDKITLWGQGTGGYLSLATSYLKSNTEIYTTADQQKFLIPTANGPVPMVIEAYNGNVNATGPITVVDSNYFRLSQLPVGDTLCIPNHVGYDSETALCVNMGGALGDSIWMSAGEVPLISFHVTTDPFAPYRTDVLNVPSQLGPQPVVEVSGSYDLQKIANRLNLNEVFNTIPAGNDPYGDAINSDFNGLCPFSNTPNDSSSPWEWIVGGLPSPTPDDCNTDGMSARTYIDTIVGYFAPRACVALGLNCEFTTNTVEINDLDVNLRVAPNPANEFVRFTTDAQSPIKGIRVFNLNGQNIHNQQGLNQSEYILQKGNMPTGTYMVQLVFDQGTINKKVVFK